MRGRSSQCGRRHDALRSRTDRSHITGGRSTNWRSKPISIRWTPHPAIAGKGYSTISTNKKTAKEIYFFSNSTDDTFTTPVELRGRWKLQEWDPYTGAIRDLTTPSYVQRHGTDYTRFDLHMPAVHATFIIGTPAE